MNQRHFDSGISASYKSQGNIKVNTTPEAFTFLEVCNLSLQVSETEQSLLQSQVYNCDKINVSEMSELKQSFSLAHILS